MHSRRNRQPELRFQGFIGDWERCKLGELYAERNVRGNDSLPILSVSIHNGISSEQLNEAQLGKVVRRTKDKSVYKRVERGDLVFNMMRAWQGALGVSKVEGMVSPAYIVATPKTNFYPFFMGRYLERSEVINQLNNLSYGLMDFRKRLYWDSFTQAKVYLPEKDEQIQITALLEKLEKTIAIHQRKHDLLKELKQGYLQKLFPQNGQKVPDLRFPGFTDDWEQRKLGDLGNITSGVGFPEREQGGQTGIPFYKVSDMTTVGNETEISKSNNYVTTDQINRKRWKPVTDVPALLFAKVGAALLLNRKRLASNPFLMDNNMMAYSFNSEWDVKFGLALFQTINLAKYAQTGALPSFNGSDIAAIKVYMPKMAEQTKVGELFSILDDTIALHQQKIEELKQLKKAYLQKLFV